MRIDQLERNSSSVDQWLVNKKKFRIPIAKDENNLFKAVAEQLCPCQNYFQKIKDKCLEYYLSMVNDGQVPAEGSFSVLPERKKLAVISAAFGRNIKLFGKPSSEPEIIGSYGGTKKEIELRLTEDGFYECIMSTDFLQNGAVCQAIIYEMLYERVLSHKRSVIADTVQKVRSKKYNHNNRIKQESANSSGVSDEKPSMTSTPSKEDCDDVERPPFTFRAAKSLDPEFYRNAQYDLWLDSVKESKQTLNVGDKVNVKAEDESGKSYKGYIQTVTPDKGPVCVFVEELGTRMTVSYERLSKVLQEVKSFSTARRSNRKPNAPRKPMTIKEFNELLYEDKADDSSTDNNKSHRDNRHTEYSNLNRPMHSMHGNTSTPRYPPTNVHIPPHQPVSPHQHIHAHNPVATALPDQATISAHQPPWMNSYVPNQVPLYARPIVNVHTPNHYTLYPHPQQYAPGIPMGYQQQAQYMPVPSASDARLYEGYHHYQPIVQPRCVSLRYQHPNIHDGYYNAPSMPSPDMQAYYAVYNQMPPGSVPCINTQCVPTYAFDPANPLVQAEHYEGGMEPMETHQQYEEHVTNVIAAQS